MQTRYKRIVFKKLSKAFAYYECNDDLYIAKNQNEYTKLIEPKDVIQYLHRLYVPIK